VPTIVFTFTRGTVPEPSSMPVATPGVLTDTLVAEDHAVVTA